MKISELLSKDAILLQLNSKTKKEVITELTQALEKAGKLNDSKKFEEAIWKRENEFSTGVGEQIAIPHAKTNAVKESALAFGYSKEGIDYDSLDEQKAHIFFMIAGKEDANNEHLETLSRLSTMLMDKDFKNKIPNLNSKEELLSLIDEKEEEKNSNEKTEKVSTKNEFVLAVTACPTGIAHTYMAADSLKNKAQEMNISIKVETNGSTGVKNELTEDEIKIASAIIVAADKKVEMERFDGKVVIEVPVVQGIKNPQGLIEKAIKKDGPIYHHKKEKNSSQETKVKSGVYKHLMNGVSNMLPFVVGGGILIAISFMFGIKAFDPNDPAFNPIAKLLMDIGGGSGAFGLMVPVLAGFIGMSIADRPGFAPAMVGGLIANSNQAGFLGGLIAGFIGGYVVLMLKKLFEVLPESLEGLKPVLFYPVLGVLITGAIMLLVVVEPAKAINIYMQNMLGSMGTTNKVILGILLGAMMAVDMGGPINKAAYTFGLAMIQAGNFYPHAAIMAGGMVPPLGIAIATTIFKKKFTKTQRQAGKTNYVLGASFITEGAIPFAAADPARVIPSIIVGSAIAGGLSMAFNIGLMAPHGGIFVIGIIQGSKLLYILSILIGAFVTALMLGLLKKDIEE